MIFCKELKKDFCTKPDMYKALKANKTLIIDRKKSETKFTDWLDMRVMAVKGQDANKDGENGEVEIKLGDYVFPVINTTNYLDSHGDVHIDGIWDTTIGDQKDKVYYIINHDLEIGKVIAYPQDVQPMVKTLNWTDLGKDYTGTTQALIFKVKLTEDGNEDAIKAIIGKRALQNSIRMRYIRMKLCINDNSQYYKEEYANWLMYIDRVANRDEAEKQGYFWAVLEAAIWKEGSAVLYGSNDVTPILSSSDLEDKSGPLTGSQDKINKNANPSADSSSVSKKKQIINHLM